MDQLADTARRLQAGLGLPDMMPLVTPSSPRRSAKPSGRTARRSDVPDGTDGPALRRVRFERNNPGKLGLLLYKSARLEARPPLVLLLHGCRQDAATFARESGWLARIERAGGILAVPEQRRENNHSQCFNWFDVDGPAGRAELASLGHIVDGLRARHDCDPDRTCVVGLSAGGAMAAALMAAAPDRIAAGAVVAGLPVGVAHSAGEALHKMVAPAASMSDAQWDSRARALAPAGYVGRWPRLSVWHGTADQVVNDENAALLVQQWCALQGLAGPPVKSASVCDGRVRYEAWSSDGADTVVERWALSGVDHAYPIGPDGRPGRWVAPTAIDATAEIAAFFALGGGQAPSDRPRAAGG
ncbi:poly(3-hydroxybutyrate) depolymerase [Acidisphaera rubrifaciens HS-AP3]|uniref:Poly(3-hydroxybutyrate) depolymerase n=2 Tax=Acidisphaera TaxID=50714 RepID=A0A0D6P628_9PROT|nr:poly(3-hydroxybutyrate) depolymerase [Acidisphaera rubrifaciens HS-AP3]